MMAKVMNTETLGQLQNTTRINLKQSRHRTYNATQWAQSCNRCCCGKAVSITYFECVFVAFGTQHAMHMRHIVICGLPGSTIFFHII
jgi:hypothetical protein